MHNDTGEDILIDLIDKCHQHSQINAHVCSGALKLSASKEQFYNYVNNAKPKFTFLIEFIFRQVLTIPLQKTENVFILGHGCVMLYYVMIHFFNSFANTPAQIHAINKKDLKSYLF